MYQKPSMVRFGTFRELTLWGICVDCDASGVWGSGGNTKTCPVNPPAEELGGGGS